MKIYLLMTMICVSSFGASITKMSAGGASIPDNDPAGVTGDLIFADARLITGNLSISINSLSHPWIGDLSATLTHVGTGTTVVLFQRPGGADCGADLDGTYAFSDAGASILPCQVPTISPGIYRASDATNMAAILSSAFNGQMAGGTWRLFVSDQDAVATGSFASWTLHADVDSIANPEPTTLAMLATGLGILVAHRRR